jgi:putative cardiolipin synthase
VDRDANDPETIQRTLVDRMKPVDGLWWVADTPGKKADFAYTAIGTNSRMFHGFWSQLEATQDELLMQSPYTIFDFRARHLFRKHTEQAPDLRVVLSTNSLGSADHIVTYSANYRLRTKMFRGMGFEIYEMKPLPAILDKHLPAFDELMARAKEEDQREPYLSIHGKTFVFDRRIVYIGTMNLDPRSFYVNSECGIFIDDAAFASGTRETLLQDMSAANSWVIARNKYILGFVNRSLETISSTLPIDPWPFRNTAAFELKPGAQEMPSGDPAFYDNYENVGSFPGTDPTDQRRMITQIYKTFGMAATPLL